MKWFGLFTAGMLLAAPATARDCSDAATQTDLNICANEELERADKGLNDVYGRLRKKLKAEGSAEQPLINAQRAWIAFRDQECAFAGSDYEGGSMQPFVIAHCKTELTDGRSGQLEGYIAGETD